MTIPHLLPCRSGIASLRGLAATVAGAVLLAAPMAADEDHRPSWLVDGERVPTGAHITPTAAPGAIFRPSTRSRRRPDFIAGQAVTTALSPDRRTLLVLTAGTTGNTVHRRRVAPSRTNTSSSTTCRARRRSSARCCTVPNTFNGLAWNPAGDEFYVTGGGGRQRARLSPKPATSGREAAADPSRAYERARAATGRWPPGWPSTRAGDSPARGQLRERLGEPRRPDHANASSPSCDLRPGKSDPAQAGVPGGELPVLGGGQGRRQGVRVQPARPRDRGARPARRTACRPGRITVGGQPRRMILEPRPGAGSTWPTTTATRSPSSTPRTDRRRWRRSRWPRPRLLPNARELKGSQPEQPGAVARRRTLYVTNGGTNAVAVVRLGERRRRPTAKTGRAAGRVTGLIPTGWYPNSVSLSADGSRLYVVNGKSNAGPNPGPAATRVHRPGSLGPCRRATVRLAAHQGRPARACPCPPRASWPASPGRSRTTTASPRPRTTRPEPRHDGPAPRGASGT